MHINETCFKTGRVSTRDFTVSKLSKLKTFLVKTQVHENINLNRVEDLRELEEITGIENFLEGKICIARYGKIYRGNKVHNCQSKGAIGIYLKSLKR